MERKDGDIETLVARAFKHLVVLSDPRDLEVTVAEGHSLSDKEALQRTQELIGKVLSKNPTEL